MEHGAEEGGGVGDGLVEAVGDVDGDGLALDVFLGAMALKEDDIADDVTFVGEAGEVDFAGVREELTGMFHLSVERGVTVLVRDDGIGFDARDLGRVILGAGALVLREEGLTPSWRQLRAAGPARFHNYRIHHGHVGDGSTGRGGEARRRAGRRHECGVPWRPRV